MERRGDRAGQVPAERAEEWLRDLAREGGLKRQRTIAWGRLDFVGKYLVSYCRVFCSLGCVCYERPAVRRPSRAFGGPCLECFII
jgi:hypothetical protein